MEELSGYWEGFLIYGLGFELPFFGERIKLKAELNFIDGKISGQISEVKGPYSTGQSRNVIGFTEELMISISTAPLDDEQLVHSNSLDLIYNGAYHPEKKTMNGIWIVRNDITDDNDFPPAEGLWLLKKFDQKPTTDFDYSLLGL